MKKLVLFALLFSPLFAQANVTCKAVQIPEVVSITTADSEGAPLTGSIKITRLVVDVMDVPVSQVVSYKNTEDEIFIEALDESMENTKLKIDVKKDAGPLFPAPREGVFWGKMNHSGTTIGIRCQTN